MDRKPATPPDYAGKRYWWTSVTFALPLAAIVLGAFVCSWLLLDNTLPAATGTGIVTGVGWWLAAWIAHRLATGDIHASRDGR